MPDARLRGRRVNDLLLVIGAIAVWIALQGWILPRLGVST